MLFVQNCTKKGYANDMQHSCVPPSRNTVRTEGRILGLSDYKYVDIVEEIIYLFKVKKIKP